PPIIYTLSLHDALPISFSMLVSLLADNGADILFAAGNCGAECPASKCQSRTTETIMGANAHAKVLTVAGCDVKDARVGYSSQGADRKSTRLNSSHDQIS